jgi:hypothetical protein
MITINIDSKKFMHALEKFPREISRVMRRDMLITGREIAAYARTHHGFTARKGKLERSIQVDVSPSGTNMRVFLDDRIAPHAAAVHNGSKPHKIEAKNKKALYFVKGGNSVFAKSVNHPGTRPDEFLFNAFHRLRRMIVNNIQHSIDKAYKIARV